MKQIPLLLLCLLLTLPCALSACNQPPTHADVTDTADVSDTQDTVKTSDTAADTETDAVTEPAPIIPTLTPVIEKSNRNLVISQLHEPITVEIIDGVTIDLNYHGWPTLCSGDDDTVYAVSSVRRGHLCPFGAIGFSKSEDGGLTWTDTEIIVDTPIDDRDAGVVYLGDGHIVVFWFTMYPDRYVGTGDFSDDWRNLATPEQQAALEKKFASLTAEEKRVGSYAIHSTDYGETWGEVVQLPINMPHGATVAQDGNTLLCYGMPWASGDVLGFDLSMNALYVMKSEDGGYTWDFMSSIGLPVNNPGPGYCTEPHVIQLDNGSYLAAYRNQDGTDMTIFLSRSEDGKKWTTPTEIEGILGGPPHLMQLDNGAILVTYSYRVSPRCGIRGALSYDGGLTWSEEFVISESERRTSTDLGYPSSVQLPNGTILTGYYDMKKGDTVCSFLYTKWHLEETAE